MILSKLEFKPTYRVLHKEKGIEVRKYPPIYRTVNYFYYKNGFAETKQVFLPFPYQVYCTTATLNEKTFRIAFADENDGLVYRTPWIGFNAVCVDSHYHFYLPRHMDMGEIISLYWSTYFNNEPCVEILGLKSIKEWENLNTKEITNCLSKQDAVYPFSCSLSDFIYSLPAYGVFE